MFLLFLLCVSDPLLVVDPDHTLSKFQKYLELINTRRNVAFRPAQQAKVCNDARPAHMPPLSEDPPLKFESFDASKPLPFNYTKYTWLAFTGELELPEGYDESQHLVRFQFDISNNWVGNTGDDDTPSGPEGRYWIGDSQICAIDSFHNGAMLDWDKLSNHTLQLRVFSGRAKAMHTLQTFGIYLVHKDTEAFYQRLRYLIEIINQLSDTNPDKPQLLRVVDRAVRKLDIRELHYPLDLFDIRLQDTKYKSFYDSTKAALDTLKQGLAEMPKPQEGDPTISIVGYSHIDTMWLWPINITHFKVSNTAMSMLYLQEHPPHDFENPVQWKFLATAPQHYKWMKEDIKPLFDRVIKKAKEGLWDINGLMWLEPDTNNPSGESLARQILYGVQYFNRHAGPEFKQTVLFLPDCFGFNANLPQILLQAEVDSFVTSKISWSEYTDFPYSTFQWRGIDGSIVNCHFITTPSSWGSAMTYTGTSTARELIGTWKSNKQNDLIRTSALHTSGNGDGGGGITEEMVWNFNIFNELPRIQEVPRLKFRTIEEVMVEVRNVSKQLPVWDDELYLEYHRGTYTSFEEVKRQNRNLEAHLHNVEWLMTTLYTLQSTPSQSVRDSFQPYLDKILPVWEDTLLFHFHDCIPGSSINEANIRTIEAGQKDLDLLRDLEDELSQKLSDLIQGSEGQILFNTLSHDRYVHDQSIPSGGWAYKEESTTVLYDNDNTTQYERTFDEKYQQHVIHQPFIQTSYPVTKKGSDKVLFDASERKVETPFFTVEFDEKTFGIKHVIDKKTGIDYIAEGRLANQFLLYEDRSIQYPAWDIQLYHREMQLEGPVLDSFEFTDSYVQVNYHIKRNGEESDGKDCYTTTINQTITFSQNDPFIDFRTLINWTQHDKHLKVSFPTDIRSRNARYGIQFGNLQRPTHNNTRRDMAKFEVFGRWCDLAEQDRGVTLMSDIKSGFDVHESEIKMSLLKAAMQEDQWEDFGQRKFTYRAVFHPNTFSEARIQDLHTDLITPPVLTTKNEQSQHGKLAATQEFVTVSDHNIVLDTLKIAEEEDGFICRLYESSGTRRKATVTFPLLSADDWTDPEVVTILEVPFSTGKKVISKGKNSALSFEVELKPFQIISFLITRKNQARRQRINHH
ncbi:Alpha-mannosidase 2C1 [Tritrichomonas musculus]|uniref:alpha-mannosidase n=1 Tax=Tritrichomonas musculus TaxID=1915356 RepID=A0ABR2HGX8_9EUKA